MMALHASHTSPTAGLSQVLGAGDSVATTARLPQDCDTLAAARLTTSSNVAPWEPSARQATVRNVRAEASKWSRADPAASAGAPLPSEKTMPIFVASRSTAAAASATCAIGSPPGTSPGVSSDLSRSVRASRTSRARFLFASPALEDIDVDAEARGRVVPAVGAPRRIACARRSSPAAR